MGEYFEIYEPSPRSVPVRERSYGSETVWTDSSPSPRTRHREAPSQRSSRVVQEAHATYEQIQGLIDHFSEQHGVSVRRAPQGEQKGRSSPRPPFLKEAEFLRQNVDGIQFPETVAYQDYDGDPSAEPVVMKNEKVSQGQQKYLLETPQQLQKFREWMQEHGQKKEWLAQKYIRSPGNAPCTFRVLVDCTGHIVVSQISYGPPYSDHMRLDRATTKDVSRDPSKFLECPGHDSFLNARLITSNHIILHDDDSTTGGRICLDPLPVSHPTSRKEKNILKAHGLDDSAPHLPREVSTIASGIGKALGMKNNTIEELVLGVDIVQREGTQDFYVLEVNRKPSMAPIRDWLGEAGSAKEVDAWRWLINGSMLRVVENAGA